MPVNAAGESGGWTYSLARNAGAASSMSTGDVSWSVAPCQVTAHGTFHEESKGGTATSSASTALDTALQFTLKTTAHTPYTLTGFVRAAGSPTTAPPLQRHLKCTGLGTVADGNIQNPSGQPIPFEEHGELDPENEYLFFCDAIRGGAAADGFPDDSADLEWTFTVTLGQ